jgi:chemotaxis protein CheC
MTTQISNQPSATCERTDLSTAITEASSDRPDLGILQELGSIGAGHAATSLSEVLQQQVLIDIPKIHSIAPHLLPQYYKRHEVPTTAVYMQLANSECDILLMFEVSEAKKIAAMMTMAPSVEELDPAMEASAMQELANILIGSFLTAISDFTGVGLMPTTPERAVDTFDAIIDNFLVKQCMNSEEALIFDTHFKRAGEDANSILMIFPSPQLQSQLIEKSKEQMGL